MTALRRIRHQLDEVSRLIVQSARLRRQSRPRVVIFIEIYGVKL